MFKAMIEECRLRNFSQKTIEIYLHYNEKLLQFSDKSPQQIKQEDIRKFLLDLISRRKTSSTINLAHNAINFYYNTIMKRKFNLPYQKREHKLKQIASREEIKKMMEVTKNPKHKLIISLLYSSGIRRSELIKIMIKDIDFQQGLLKVKQGKGNKDRITIISNLTLLKIKEYLQKRPYKSEYLFASREHHITASTVEQIVKQARNKAQIKSNITPHSLRHSFATHHMEQGTKTEYIQQMLGHKDIRTTRNYEQITTSHLKNIKSPQDNI